MKKHFKKSGIVGLSLDDWSDREEVKNHIVASGVVNNLFCIFHNKVGVCEDLQQNN